jgi:hypothetical protein
VTRFAEETRAAFRRGDSAAVSRLAQAEADRARSAGDADGQVEALYALARVAIRGDDLRQGEELALAALDVAVRAGDRSLEERPRHVLAAVARLSGDYVTARERYLASIRLNEELGRPEAVSSEHHNLAFTELHLGNLERARELFRRVRQDGYSSFLPYLCVAAAALASADGDQPLAARMAGLADAGFAAIGQVPDPDDAKELASARTAAQAALGRDRFEQEYAAGTVLTPDDALVF